MPKAPRDKGSAAPKKRTSKTAPGNGNGVHAENGNGAHAQNGNGAAAIPATVSSEMISDVRVTPNLEEQIRVRAYEIYLQRGGDGGSPEQDWLRAVEEICGQPRTA
jgi:hypothetical protein